MAALWRVKDDSVSLFGVAPQMFAVIGLAAEIYGRHDIELVITSANDARHSLTSLHYAGAALDFRSRTLTADQAQSATDELSSRLGLDFDVLYEDPGGPNEHIHVEFQPRRRW